jgi:hypothetical protein
LPAVGLEISNIRSEILRQLISITNGETSIHLGEYYKTSLCAKEDLRKFLEICWKVLENVGKFHYMCRNT